MPIYKPTTNRPIYAASGRPAALCACCQTTPPPGQCLGCPQLQITYTAGNPVGNNTCSISYSGILLTATCIPLFSASRKITGSTTVSGSQLLRNLGANGTPVCTFRNQTAQGVPIEATWGAALDNYLGTTVCAGSPAITSTRTVLNFDVNASVGIGISASISIAFYRSDGALLLSETIFSGTAGPSGTCSFVTINNAVTPPGVNGAAGGGGQMVLSFA